MNDLNDLENDAPEAVGEKQACEAEGRRMTRPDRCPYGWRPDPSNPNNLIEDAEEQASIARIRQERDRGRGLREIARCLDRAGIHCRGRGWTHSAVRSVLQRVGLAAVSRSA
jgi:hypothetical protein